MKDKTNDRLYAKLVSSIFLSLMMFTVIKRLLFFTKYSIIIATAASFIIPICIFFKIIWQSKLKINYGYILLLIFIVSALYMISFLRGVPFNSVLQYYFFTIYGLLLMYFTFTVKKLDVLYDEFQKKSFYISLVAILIIFSNRANNPYNMRFSYILSIALYFQTIKLINNFKITNLFFVVMDLYLILIYGSRGPLLCYCIFLIIYIIFNKNNIYIKFFFCSFILFVYMYFDKIIMFISGVMSRFNITSRTLYLMVGDLSHNSGRDIILGKTKELIQAHPIMGLGVAGEFKYMIEYPHNIFFDLLLHWGVILGTALFIFLLVLIIKSFIKATNKKRMLLLVFTCYGFVALFFSGTYLSWDGFYILFGIMIRILIGKEDLEWTVKVNY